MDWFSMSPQLAKFHLPWLAFSCQPKVLATGLLSCNLYHGAKCQLVFPSCFYLVVALSFKPTLSQLQDWESMEHILSSWKSNETWETTCLKFHWIWMNIAVLSWGSLFVSRYGSKLASVCLISDPWNAICATFHVMETSMSSFRFITCFLTVPSGWGWICFCLLDLSNCVWCRMDR